MRKKYKLQNILLLCLALIGLVTLLERLTQINFGDVNYWDVRGVFFLIAVAMFPRLTLLFSSVVSGGALWWLAWIFAPRVLVAFLATVAYWNTNPVLVLISWFVALSAESGEKIWIKRKVVSRSQPRDIEVEVLRRG